MSWPAISVWLLLTYPLHMVLHEGAHWVAYRAFQWHARIDLLPRLVPGGVEWARTWPIDGPALNQARYVTVLAAPVLAELVWMVLALSVALRWRWAGLEAIPSAVDLLVWFLGCVRRRELTDGGRVRAELAKPG